MNLCTGGEVHLEAQDAERVHCAERRGEGGERVAGASYSAIKHGV